MPVLLIPVLRLRRGNTCSLDVCSPHVSFYVLHKAQPHLLLHTASTLTVRGALYDLLMESPHVFVVCRTWNNCCLYFDIFLGRGCRAS